MRPGAKVISLHKWPDSPQAQSDLRTELTTGREGWWLIDEAQLLFRCEDILQLLRDAKDVASWIILFSSYGSAKPGRWYGHDYGDSSQPSPVWIGNEARVTLRSSEGKVNLLFDESEMVDVFERASKHAECPSIDGDL